MKKFFWLVLMLLAGCGGGSSQGGTDAAAGTGTLYLKVAQLQEDLAPKTVTALEAIQPTRLRVVVSNRNLNYRKILDVALGEPFETISLPAGAGYKAELLYYKSGAPNLLSQYWVATGIDIISESLTSKEATLHPIQVPLAFPASVSWGVPYEVPEPSAQSLEAFALQPKWSLSTSTSPFSSRSHLAQPPASVHTGVSAPANGDAVSLYFQGEFFLKPELLKGDEKWEDWVFVAESAAVPFRVGYVYIDISNLVERVKPVVQSFSLPRSRLKTGLISPIEIVATDNGEIRAYMITETDTPPDTLDPRWSTSPPASYSYAPAGGLPHGQDVSVSLYVWVKDYCGNVSELTAFSQGTVVINDSP